MQPECAGLRAGAMNHTPKNIILIHYLHIVLGLPRYRYIARDRLLYPAKFRANCIAEAGIL